MNNLPIIDLEKTGQNISMSDIKLLPCPCCGSTEVRIGKEKGICCTWYQVICFECGMRTGELPVPESVVEVWNTRKPMDRIVEQLSKMEKKPTEWGIPYIDYDKAIEIVKAGGNNGKSV